MYNLLIVDDEPRTAEALDRNIDWKGCGIRKTFHADSMRSAISLIEKEKLNIMVCDIEMPNGSGLQLLEWLQAHNIEMHCIFLTCHPEFDYTRRAIQLKCYDYILKPVNYEEFSTVITELVRKIEASDAGIDLGMYEQRINIVENEAAESSLSGGQNLETRVKKYIYEHMVDDDISVNRIAEELHFNPQYMMRAFKKGTDMSIIEYITKTRVDSARKLLKETNLPVKKIAGMVGYADYAYFNRVFKKETGEAPNAYRARARKNGQGL